MIRKKIKVILRGKSKYRSILLNSLINNNTDTKKKYHSTQNEKLFFSFAHKDDSIYSVELYDNITSSENNILCVLYVFDYMNDGSFIECADKGSKEHFENIFKAKNNVDIIPKIVFICCDYPFYSDAEDDKVNFYIKILTKKKLSDNDQSARTQIIFTNIKSEFLFKEKIQKLFVNVSEEKPKIVDVIRSEEEYKESESGTNSSSETAHESNHIKRHKNKTLLDKLLSLVTNCCGTREKHIYDDNKENINNANVTSCDSGTN